MSEEAMFEMEAKRRGLTITELKMLNAAPDSLLRDIVSDARKGISQSTSMIPTTEREPVRRVRGGWIEPRELQSPPGIALVDRLCEAQDAKDRLKR